MISFLDYNLDYILDYIPKFYLLISYYCLQDNSSSHLSLENYPARLLLRVSIAYNTTLLTSAPIEILFSFTGIIRNLKRGRLADDLFEHLVLLKTNKSYN